MTLSMSLLKRLMKYMIEELFGEIRLRMDTESETSHLSNENLHPIPGYGGEYAEYHTPVGWMGFLQKYVKNVTTYHTVGDALRYIEFLQWEEALSFIYWMRRTTKDYVTLSLILCACSGLSDVVLEKQVHGFVYGHEFYSYDYVTNALIDMYGKCGNLRSSGNCFFEIGQLCRDKASWNALITSYASHWLSEEALRIFEEMQWETTLMSSLSAPFLQLVQIYLLLHKEIKFIVTCLGMAMIWMLFSMGN
ncbi:hypothetical protein GIB67_017852 [Kingdonia uniflora]|uniref:Pentatricopeptide repeat-containing protein n=1 Tax=Kingdonia uniflora TaxID=39325 RepID=A0A7J7MKY6_9MAGN|nr:hypothetical protein GIB67_017852 [Kingdonia uniflora]